MVVGSINMDLVGKTERMPRGGETLRGSDFRLVPGGKGANQAVAVARTGGQVKMLGRVGNDVFGHQLVEKLQENNVDTRMVKATEGVPTGVAIILVDAAGENSIVVVPGANDRVSPSDVEEARAVLEGAQSILVQLEIPLETVQAVIAVAKNAGVPVILDPGPAQPLAREILAGVDIITPNEHEAQVLTGEKLENMADARRIAETLVTRGVKTVILKLGDEGAILAQAGHVEHIPAHKVKAEDTTAAGDSFAGGLAVALAEGCSIRDAVLFANAVGALSVTKMGAQSSIPTRAEVDAFLQEQGILL